MKLSEVLQKTKDHFKKLGFESASLDAEILISHALNWKRLDLYVKLDYPLNERELEAARALVKRRSAGEPVAYILGTKSFYNIELNVNKNVLIPRPETEHLVDEALAYLKEHQLTSPHILDLGAGSGCIGLALLKELPEAKLISVELSSEAADLLLENAKLNGLEGRLKLVVKPVESLTTEDLCFDQGSSAIDVLVSNPPYIDRNDPDLDVKVLASEPELALFAKDEGLEFYKTWPELVYKGLKTGAVILFEIGHKQGQAVSEIFNSKDYLSDVSVIQDYSQKDRVIRARIR